MKKGVSIAINTVVIISLALIVLVVLIMLVNRMAHNANDFLDSLSEVEMDFVMSRCQEEQGKIFFYRSELDRKDGTPVAIKNTGAEGSFEISVSKNAEWFDYRTDPVRIDSYECMIIGITVEAPDGDTEIIDLIVLKDGSDYASKEMWIG